MYNKNRSDFCFPTDMIQQNIYSDETSPSRLPAVLEKVYHMFLGLRRSCPVVGKNEKKNYWPAIDTADLFHSVAIGMADYWLINPLRNKNKNETIPAIHLSRRSIKSDDPSRDLQLLFGILCLAVDF